MQDLRGDLDYPVNRSEIFPKAANAPKNPKLSLRMSRPHDDNKPDLENNGSLKLPFYLKSSEMRISPSSAFGTISHELQVPTDQHPARRPRLAASGPNFHQSQYDGFHSFKDYFSKVLLHIYDAGVLFCISSAFFLRSNQYTNWLAKFLISVIFLMSTVWYFVPAFNTFSFCQLAGPFFSANPQSNPCSQPGYRPCWFEEEASFGSRLAQVNDKLVNIADVAVLDSIPTDLATTREKVADLYAYIRLSSKDPLEKVLDHLLDYSPKSIFTEMHLTEFTRELGLTMIRVYSTTQLTVEGLKYISKIQRSHADVVWVLICILDSIFGGSPFWTDALRCSTSLCASLFVQHIDEVIPNIRMREEDALRLVRSFGTLRGHLKGADDIQRLHQHEHMMQFYQTYPTNQTENIDAHIWTRIKAFWEIKIWTRLKIFFVGKEFITTALETTAPENNLPQLILPFLEWAEEHFDQIVSNLKELEVELIQLRQRAKEQENWTTIRCAFKKTPIRLWSKQLKSSFRIRIPLKKRPEGQRKIDMSPSGESCE